MTDVLDNTSSNTVLAMDFQGDAGTYSGRIDTAGDHDWIRLTLQADVHYNFFLALQAVGSADGDSEMTIRDADGNAIVSNDDTGRNTNSFLDFAPTADGTFYLDVFEHNDDGRGAYSLLMTSLDADNVFLGSGSDNPVVEDRQRIAGGAGDDGITLGTEGFDALGEQGNDTLSGNARQNILSGGLGNDFLTSFAANDRLFGDAGDDTIFAGDDNDDLFGGDGSDDLFGERGDDRLSGGADDDNLDGGSGSDLLNGGPGTDRLTGGSEADFFAFKAIQTSIVGSGRDQILDFSHAEGDKIDLSDIDANLHRHGDQSFKFIGGHGFSHHAGELRYSGHILQADINGDGRADFEVEVNAPGLLAIDFIL